MDEKAMLTDRKLLWKCLIVLALTILGFFLHQSFIWSRLPLP